MATTDYITDVTANLTDWGIDYRETTEGVSVGNIHLEITEDGYRPAGTILDGTETVVAITSDADKAAALLAFPLARKAWAAGYMGDFEVDVLGGEMDMRLSYGSDDVTISADVDSDREFTVTEHPLFSDDVTMTDLEAVLESTQLAYQNSAEAWQVLCNATDFAHDDWQALVENFQRGVRYEYGDRLTKVESAYTERVTLVEECGPESPIRVIDIEVVSDATCWSQGDVAAAVLHAIS